jgi:hypothetical protein
MTGLLLMPFLVTVDAGFNRVLKPKPDGAHIPVDDVDMLIFVSPQYAYDDEILQAINNYISAVEEDVNWSTEVICISSELNDFKRIDNVIESYYENYSIKACIMVGEDTDTALAADTDYLELPSTVPWYTTGGESSYTICETGIIGEPHQMDICVSLIYPTSDLDYQTKKSQIISVFNKFSVHRHVYYLGDILVFVDSGIADDRTRNIYQSMGDYGNLYYKEDPTDSELQDSLEESYSMYYVCGHSNPSSTCVNGPPEGVAFQAYYLDQLDTPFFGATGCYVNGWDSNFTDNNRLDPSIRWQNPPYYGSKIFTAPRLRVAILGILSQFGYSYPVSFIEHAIPDLTSGKTLADSMIGHIYSGDCQTVVGDPAFHYSFENEPPSAPNINGSVHGRVGKKYDYTFTTVDPDGDAVYYYIDWGDFHTHKWIGLNNSDEEVKVSHVWNEKGNYTIRAKAKDSYGAESEWGYLEVTMSKNKAINTSFMQFLKYFLKNHPNLFPILRFLLIL